MANNGASSGANDANAAARSRRRVCNLTPSQVEKKRAIDRTNQQHWRQKKRLYIAELEAEVARLKASLDASQAKLRMYEGANDMDVAVDNSASTSSPARAFHGEPATLGLSAVPAVTAGPATSSLPRLLPAPSSRVADNVARPSAMSLDSNSGSASPASTEESAFAPPPGSRIQHPPNTAVPDSSSASSDVGWPLSIVTPDVSPRTRQAGLLSLQSAAQIQAQTRARTEGSLRLDIFDPTHSFQLFDHSLSDVEVDVGVHVDVDEVFDAQPIFPSGLVSTLDSNYLQEQQHNHLQDQPQQNQNQQRHQNSQHGLQQNQQQPNQHFHGQADLHRQLQQVQRQVQQHNSYYRPVQRYQALHGTTPPSPLSTNLSYMPYYLAGRYQEPNPGLPDWMVLPLNLPVATELDKLALITCQALVQQYSTHEFSQPVFPSIEGLMSRLRTDNTPRHSRHGSVYGASSGGGSSSNIIGEELLRALTEASAGGSSSTLSPSSLTAAAKASAAAAAAASPPSPSAASSSSDDNSLVDTASRPVLAAVASHVVWKSPLKHLTGRLAFLYKLALFLRWCLCPTKENYDALPEFMKPTMLQRRVPHPAWVDMIIWPDVRDNLIRGGDYSAFELFRFVTGNTISVNWPYTDSGTFVECADGKSLAFNPIFEAHIRNVDNYSVGCQAAIAFPMLSRYVRVT
ncbi:hypothetical protein SEUCBS139899_003561 [Sporothrix eucalyptigena]|uniref:BZIP domain-containing protein n=1 Tax=Sporothrix eucalyptigena TaxID=1812306 RepID=A0ABP0B6Y9_9PEZI